MDENSPNRADVLRFAPEFADANIRAYLKAHRSGATLVVAALESGGVGQDGGESAPGGAPVKRSHRG